MFFVYSGITSGLLLGSGIGNVKVSLIKTTLENGVKAGSLLLGGVALSDFLLISIVNAGSSWFAIPQNWEKNIFLGTGILFIVLGSMILLKLFFETKKTGKVQVSGKFKLPFVKGFLINTLNPYNYLTWMGFMVFLNKINADKTDKLIFFFFALLGMLIIDGLILFNIRRANWLLKYSRQLSILNALIFIALGLKLLI